MTIWKTIPGYGNHYQISREGLVRVNPKSPRLKSLKPNNLKGGALVKRHVSSDGYWRVNLKPEEGGGYTSCHVHRILLLTFRPTKKPNRQVNHKDGDKLNNSLGNLEWVTHLENLSHAWENGLRPQPHHVILTVKQVKEIRGRYRKGSLPTLKDLGDEYGVSLHAIAKIVKFKNWKNI